MKAVKVKIRVKDSYIFGTTPSTHEFLGSIIFTNDGELIVDTGQIPGEYILFYDYHFGYVSDDKAGGEIKEIKRDEFDYDKVYHLVLDDEGIPMMMNGKIVLMENYDGLEAELNNLEPTS